MRTTAAFSRHALLALLEALLLAALISAVLASAALINPAASATGVGSAAAANPHPPAPSSIWLMPPADATAAGWPTLGSSVAFGSIYPKATRNPWVSLTCHQGTSVVYVEGGVTDHVFMLGGGSSVWLSTGGSAVCTAELGDLYWRGGQEYYTYLATTSFTAN